MVPACPECGAPLRGVDDVRLQEHIDHKYPIICGDCGNSSPALEWREGKVPKTRTPEAAPALEKVLEVDEDEEEGPVKKVMMPAKEERRYAANPHLDRPDRLRK